MFKWTKKEASKGKGYPFGGFFSEISAHPTSYPRPKMLGLGREVHFYVLLFEYVIIVSGEISIEFWKGTIRVLRGTGYPGKWRKTTEWKEHRPFQDSLAIVNDI